MRQELRIAKELDDMFNGRASLYSGDLGYAAQLLRTLVARNDELEAAQERRPLEPRPHGLLLKAHIPAFKDGWQAAERAHGIKGGGNAA